MLSMSVFRRKRGSSKSVTTLMTIVFIQYPLLISPENKNLDKMN